MELLLLAGAAVSALWAIGIPLSRPRFLRHFSRHQLYSYTIEQGMKWGGGTYYKVTNTLREANTFDKPLTLVAGDSEEFKLRYRAAHAMAKRSSYLWPLAAVRHTLAMRAGLAFKEGLESAQQEELEKLRSTLLLEAYRDSYESIMPEVVEAETFGQLRAVHLRIQNRRLSLAGQQLRKAALPAAQ